MYSDPLGTPLAEASTSGSITATYHYAPYGTQVMGMPPSGPGYTGHVNDPDTALVYMQHRYYDPSMGRFLSVDPKTPTAGNPFDFNRFAYVNDNPILNIDPDGTTCTPSVRGLYSCQLDGNKGGLSAKQIQAVKKAYTNAVNRLNSHPGVTTTVTVKGVSFQARAGDVASGLVNARVDTGPVSASARAQTLGGGLAATSNYYLNYTPETMIFKNAVTSDRNGGTANIATDLERTFVHEGIHTLPKESALKNVYYGNMKGWNALHQDEYNEAADKLYYGSK
ncbi:RHS repeat-associated core domain-containing protein [Rhodanobacter sp. C03]|uniref:RHS repeat-associated core domain-containing protein n=1 Tax=Rhodanobacter sp. C03 TaxID=1945858 RepID=UPI000985BFD2|nr:RHS repeat-associated core domain-containing protein [Rhodanobacter sp. C03]OOG59320.1 hypothetical protein B0E48_00310 [Rhodanobacter sp. C03]